MMSAIADIGGTGTTDSQGLVRGLQDRLTKRFKSLPTRQENKRLSVLLVGFRYGFSQSQDPESKLSAAIITNFQDLYGDGAPANLARQQFDVRHEWAKDLAEIEPTYVQYLGAYEALRSEDLQQLRSMLARRLPASAVAERATDVMLRAASARVARNTVGRQLTIVTVPSSPNKPAIGRYVTQHPSTVTYEPDYVIATRDVTIALSDPRLASDSPNARPLAVPKVPSTWPCPCDSGKRYKNCHGRFARHPR
ncbi:SEC-C metal-binding domain-containing protein [Micromonospora profundi]|uniref:SEC-C metal-binding domain-containing protein n=1 Tax=Micromonospora profundi TaxID=1420889 RepID=UPI0036624C34